MSPAVNCWAHGPSALLSTTSRTHRRTFRPLRSQKEPANRPAHRLSHRRKHSLCREKLSRPHAARLVCQPCPSLPADSIRQAIRLMRREGAASPPLTNIEGSSSETGRPRPASNGNANWREKPGKAALPGGRIRPGNACGPLHPQQQVAVASLRLCTSLPALHDRAWWHAACA